MLRDEPEQVPETAREHVFSGRVFDFDSVQLDFRGETLRRQWLVHPGSVAVLALDASDRVLVLQQFRAPVGARMWELPAGLRDVAGEAAVNTARRELAEEAELAAATWQELASFVPTGGSSNETVQVFLATSLTPTTTDFVRTGEEADMQLQWVPFEELLATVLAGGVRNSALMIGVLTLAAKRHASN